MIGHVLKAFGLSIRTRAEEDDNLFHHRGWLSRERDGETVFRWSTWFKPSLTFKFSIRRHAVFVGLGGMHVYVGVSDDNDDEREVSVSFHDGTLHWCLGMSPYHWSSEEGWRHSWWNVVDTLLGRAVHTSKVVETRDVTVYIPAELFPPECAEPSDVAHKGVAKLSRDTWKRPRWFARSIMRVQLDFPDGVPSGHKGPTYGSCAPARSIEQGIGEFIGHILERRSR